MTRAHRYRVGPYTVDVSALPESWQAYAPTQYHPAVDDETPLAVSLRHVGAGAHGPSTVDVQSQRVTRDGDRYVIENVGAFRAWFDPRAHTLVMDVEAHLELPHIVFGNALRGAVSLALPLAFDGLMVHASSAFMGGRGAFFPGISTAGKTTLALGFTRATYLSDDVSLVDRLASAPRQLPSPFFGAFGRQGADVATPLACVGVLVAKAERETTVTRLTRADATALLLRHVVSWTADKTVHGAILARVVELAARVPVFAVERFLDDPSDDIFARLLEATEGA